MLAAGGAAPWPALREDLTLHPGAPALDGSYTWSLQDPSRNLFFRIDWPSFEILSRWHLADAESIVESVQAETPLDLDGDDVVSLMQFLRDNQLLALRSRADTELLEKRRRLGEHSLFTNVLHHYLFFRVPLWQPDRWLQTHLHWVDRFYTRGFFLLTFAVLLYGVSEIARQWTSFTSTLVDTFTLRGLMGYGIALVFVKFLHELGHAFTARRLGCRVPAMGLAFLVMWPVAYTDVNEAWKLRRRSERLAVGCAGVATELIIAAWATLLWVLLPDGLMRGTLFLLATTTWVSTVFINASPFMRFDGYFILADALDMPNLHARAFALARWQMREWLFGYGEEAPEHFSPFKRRCLIVFAYAIWVYRLLLFLGIAALVYHFFIKAVGILLFAVEIGWFVLLPLYREVRVWWEKKSAVRSPRGLIVLAALTGLLVYPWSQQIETQGMLKPAVSFPLFAPAGARVVEMPVKTDAIVRKGQTLLKLEPADQGYLLAQAQARLEKVRWQLESSSVDENTRARRTILEEEFRSAQAEVQALLDDTQRFEPAAPFDGRLVDLQSDVGPGDWVGKNQRLGTLIDEREWLLEAYVTESDVRRLSTGAKAWFVRPADPGFRLKAVLTEIDSDASRTISEPMLALQHGGELPLREKKNGFYPEQTLYRVVLKVDAAGQQRSIRQERGTVLIEGSRQPLLTDWMRSAMALLIREATW
jgi:putative peptide zinc metalloprotease protein